MVCLSILVFLFLTLNCASFVEFEEANVDWNVSEVLGGYGNVALEKNELITICGGGNNFL